MSGKYALTVNLAIATCAAAPGALLAQTYPAKSLRVVVGFQAGGGVDMSARAVGKYLTEALGQSIVVDNKPGAAGRTRAVNRVPACGM